MRDTINETPCRAREMWIFQAILQHMIILTVRINICVQLRPIHIISISIQRNQYESIEHDNRDTIGMRFKIRALVKRLASISVRFSLRDVAHFTGLRLRVSVILTYFLDVGLTVLIPLRFFLPWLYRTDRSWRLLGRLWVNSFF